MLLNDGVGEDSWESLRQQGDQTSQSKGNQSWVFIGRADVEAESPILWPPDAKNWLIWKDPDASERLKAGGEGDDRGWDGWMASPTQWTWVWVNSRSWWWTGRSGVPQSMRSQSQTRQWLNWTEWNGFQYILKGWKRKMQNNAYTIFVFFCNSFIEIQVIQRNEHI